MAVLVREKINLRGEETIIKVFYPSGNLSKSDRERAERLDEYLQENIPKIATKILKKPEDKLTFYKWYQFGKELRKITKNEDLVSPIDVKNGYIWQAVRQHLPESFPLKDTGKIDTKKTSDKTAELHGNRGHLALCYVLAGYQWKDIKWLRQWGNWHKIYHRAGIIKDDRIFQSLKSEITQLKKYPTGAKFTQIIVNMAKQFPQRAGQKVHSSVFDDAEIQKRVREAVKSALQ